MGLPKRLTEKQREFARLLVTSKGKMTNAQCAIEAGYSEKRARQEASELQNAVKSPLVVKYIEELREKNFDDNRLAINKVLEEKGDMRGIESIKPLIKGTFQDFYDDGLKTSISNEAKKQSAFLGSISGMETRSEQLKKDERVKENEFRKIATMYGKDLNTYQMTEKNRNEIYSKLAEDLKIDELKQIHTNAKINQQNVGRQKGVDPVDMLPMPFTYKIPLSEYQTTGAGYYGGYGAMGGSSIASPGHEEMTEENFKKHLRQSKKQHLIDESKKAGISRRNMELDKINIVADNYAKDNYKIFYEDYQTYVVEALKDMDPAMLEKSLQRLESEVLLKKEFKGI